MCQFQSRWGRARTFSRCACLPLVRLSLLLWLLHSCVCVLLPAKSGGHAETEGLQHEKMSTSPHINKRPRREMAATRASLSRSSSCRDENAAVGSTAVSVPEPAVRSEPLLGLERGLLLYALPGARPFCNPRSWHCGSRTLSTPGTPRIRTRRCRYSKGLPRLPSRQHASQAWIR